MDSDRSMYATKQCSECDGTGKLWLQKSPTRSVPIDCDVCDGDGLVLSLSLIHISEPTRPY